MQNLQGRDRRAMEEDVTKAIREHRKSREEEERKVQERLLGYPRMDAMVDVKWKRDNGEKHCINELCCKFPTLDAHACLHDRTWVSLELFR